MSLTQLTCPNSHSDPVIVEKFTGSSSSTKPNSLLLTSRHCPSESSPRQTENIHLTAISNKAHFTKCNISNSPLEIIWNLSCGTARPLSKLHGPSRGSKDKESRSYSYLHLHMPAITPVLSDKLYMFAGGMDEFCRHLMICKVLLPPSSYLIFQEALAHTGKLISLSAFNR